MPVRPQSIDAFGRYYIHEAIDVQNQALERLVCLCVFPEPFYDEALPGEFAGGELLQGLPAFFCQRALRR